MRKRIFIVLVVIAAAVAARVLMFRRTHRPHVSRTAPIQIMVTTSIIESMVKDIAGKDVDVFSLVPPGSCPGHFDLKPGDLQKILDSDLFIRHDYQAHLDRKLREPCNQACDILVIQTKGSQLIPENYLDACRQVLEALVKLMPSRKNAFDQAYKQTEQRVLKAAEGVMGELQPLADKPVLASSHQQAFCQWAGLRVIGVFDQGEDMSLKQLARLADTGEEANVVAIIGNVQRGEREPMVIAERLDVPVVMLSNFPDRQSAENGYVDLLKHNCDKLLKILRDD